jgi:hypothetical protein
MYRGAWSVVALLTAFTGCHAPAAPSADKSVCRISDKVIEATVHPTKGATTPLDTAKTISPFLDGMKYADLHDAASLEVAQANSIRPNAAGLWASTSDFSTFLDAASALSHLCVDKYHY